MKINPYDHEDAFTSANLHAGSVTNLSEALKDCTNRHLALRIIQDAQKLYSNLFDAFIAGVDYGRKNPLKENHER